MSVSQQIIIVWSKNCPSCQASNDDDASNCRSCGNGLSPGNPWPR